jgi:ABC-type nitrate/sulfonate/bicarbonate transport system permease component
MRKYITTSLILFLFIIFWEIAAIILKIDKWILPAPSAIFSSLLESRALFAYHLMPTLFEAMLGLSISILFAIAMSVIIKLSNFLREIIYPFLILSQTVPFIVIAPLLAVWFGFGLLPKIILISIVCFFPITLNLVDGFESIDQSFIRLMNSMGATKIQKFKYLYWSSSLPYFFSGFKISASYCVLSAVISEWVGSDRGLGILLIRSSKSYATDRVFATIFVITVLSIILVLFVDIAERIAIPWKNKN